MSEAVIIELIDVGSGLIQLLLSKLKSHVPAEVVASLQAAVDSMTAHKADLVTKANFEAQRG